MKIPLTLFVASALALIAPAHAQTVLFHDDFEGGLSNWTTETPWHLTDSAASTCLGAWTPLPSGTHCAWYGSESSCDYDLPIWGFTSLTMVNPIALPTDASSIKLEFMSGSDAEDNEWDTRDVMVSTDGSTWVLRDRLYSAPWRQRTVDLSGYAGQSIFIRFTFWAGDPWGNNTIGWLIDDVTVRTDTGAFTAGCSGDQVHYYAPNACPCTNYGAVGHGCANSFNPDGALLVGGGSNSISADTTSLTVSGVSNTTVTFIQRRVVSPLTINLYSDGLLCGGNPTVRIGSVAAVGNSATYPQVGQLPISVRGAVTALAERSYQVVYRNPPAFCTAGTFNTSNSVTTTWQP